MALGLVAGASVWAVLILASNTVPSSNGLTVAYRLYAIAAPAIVGVLWWRRRPTSRIGTQLMLLAGLAAIMAWQASAFTIRFSVGVFAEAPYVATALFLCLAFPTGRLEGRAAKVLAALIAVTLLATFVPWFVSGSEIYGSNPAFDCRPNCPPNAFALTTLPETTRLSLATASHILISVIGMGVLALYVTRIRKAARPRRRALSALALTSMLVFPATSLLLAGAIVLGPAGAERIGLTVGLAIAIIAFPIGFAVPLIQSDMAAGSQLQRLLGALARRPSRQAWREEVAAAVDDQKLRLGYWDDAVFAYLEPDGSTLSRATVERDRLWVEIARDDAPVAALVTDPALATEPELTDAVAVATVAAVTTRQLERARSELTVRAASAADTERLRIAREIQAGPQQRLAALRVHVNLLGEQSTPTPAHSFIDEFGRGLDKAIRDLGDATRTRASGTLTRTGLGAALRAAQRGSPINVRILDRGLRRHPPRSELAVYYCTLEAIQNTIKHGGAGASVTVRLFESETGIGFAIEDDGSGFDVENVIPGSGLQNIRERIDALGGNVDFRSSPGQGTLICGAIPDGGNKS